jgi:hypothetical protein
MSDADKEKEIEEEMTPSERRIGFRHFACFPAFVEQPDGEKRTAMIHDLSMTGALLNVRAGLSVGDTVRLQLMLTGDLNGRMRDAVGKVVRVEQLGPKAQGTWSHRVAVHFDEELRDVEQEIKALEAKQRKLGLKP